MLEAGFKRPEQLVVQLFLFSRLHMDRVSDSYLLIFETFSPLSAKSLPGPVRRKGIQLKSNGHDCFLDILLHVLGIRPGCSVTGSVYKGLIKAYFI